jgi:hypothetical protein
LVSPSATIAGLFEVGSVVIALPALPAMGPPGQREFDVRVGRHARLQLMIGIVDIDLDAIDERDALLYVCTLLGVNSASGEMNEMRP